MSFPEIFGQLVLRQSRWISAALSVTILLLWCVVSCRAEHLPVKVYTSADGLGSSFVSSVTRDSRGFLWFSTRDGLSRFDGREFTTYKIGTNDAPPGIELVYEDRNGIYWITTTAGIYRFDPHTQPDAKVIGDAEKNVLDAEFVTPDRSAIYQDSTGRLWIGKHVLSAAGKTSDGKFSFDEMNINFPDQFSSKYPISSIFEGADGSLWLVTKIGLIRRLPDGQTIFYTFDENIQEKINDTLIDRSGRIWIVADNSVNVFFPEPISDFPSAEATGGKSMIRKLQTKETNSLVLPDTAGQLLKFALLPEQGKLFRRIFESSDGHIWIASDERVTEFDGRNLRNYTAAQGIIDAAGAIAEDAGGNMWFAGQSGAERLNRFGMSAYTEADGFVSTVIQSVYTRGQEFYAITGNAYVSRFNGQGFETIQLQLDKGSVFGWLSDVAYPDSQGDWWALTQNKLYHFAAPKKFSDLGNEKPAAIYTKADGLKGNRFFRIFEDSHHNLWFSTNEPETDNIGLTLWTRADGKFHAFTGDAEGGAGFPKDRAPVSFAESADGSIWFGIYNNNGLVRYKDGKFSKVGAETLPRGFFSAIYFDHQNHLWLASALSGVTRIDNPDDLQTISARYTTENGLSSNNVRSLVADANDEIYVGTARGVDRIAPETGSIRHFSTNDGLNGDFVRASAVGADGVLWFGTPNGLSRFAPQIDKQESVPPVWIGNLRVAGENRFVPQLGATEIPRLELAANQNNLQIDFFAVDFGTNEPLGYQYKLEGTDQDWSEPTIQRTVNFANLAPGQYRFLVRTVKAANGVKGVSSSVTLNILAPFYRRWWFIAIVIALVGLGVLALDRYRVRKTLQVKRALDISQKSEQAARTSEMRYRTLAETASDAIITIDEKSVIMYVNEATEKIFGYQPAELIGQPLTVLMPENLRTSHEHGFNRYLATKRKELIWSAIELPGHHKSGATIPLELSFGEFESEGRRYFTGVARDVSERKRAEAALEKSRTERLAELERVRSRIARDLHDDVGSSLTQIALFSEVAKQNALSQAIAPAANGHSGSEPLDFLVQTSNELVEAMSDIVWAINPSKDRFGDLTQRMRRFASEILTAGGGIDLEFTAPEAELDAPLGANLRREIFLIFKESVNNIVKHAEAKTVKINFSAENNYLRLTINDDGNGFTVSDSGGSESGGYDWRTAKGGNGLPGMKRRAQELGGDFFVESNPGRGTTVFLTVPLDISLETTISPD